MERLRRRVDAIVKDKATAARAETLVPLSVQAAGLQR